VQLLSGSRSGRRVGWSITARDAREKIEPGVSSDTIPAQAWTCWNKAPGPGDEEWLTTDEREWSITTGQTAALNLLAVARALQARPIPAPSQS
jgi:hypothetical protein